jgi:hypothetical protein
MIQKILISATAVIVLAGISLFAAEKAKEKRAAEKQEMRAQEGDWQHHGPLLDELIAAYKANDREKMGQIIQMMEQRREKIRKFVQLNRWHRWAHRRMMMQEGPGWQHNWGMAPERSRGEFRQWAGPGWQREWAMQRPGWQQERGGCCCCGKDGLRPPAREYGQMPGFDQRRQGEPGWREGMDGRQREFPPEWSPGPGPRFGPEFNPERRQMPGFDPRRQGEPRGEPRGERPMPPRDNPPPDMDW